VYIKKSKSQDEKRQKSEEFLKIFQKISKIA
jgi:hypothetical protein